MPLTHFDAEGKARMVDVTEKKETVREATATGKIKVSRDVYDAIEAGTVGKGDVLSVATTAGIMGVKRTADLIPMCHILPITNCKIRFEKDPKNLEITCFCTVKVTGKTGVEMEALTGVSVALLTIYDMCKALGVIASDAYRIASAIPGAFRVATFIVASGVQSLCENPVPPVVRIRSISFSSLNSFNTVSICVCSSGSNLYSDVSYPADHEL